MNVLQQVGEIFRKKEDKAASDFDNLVKSFDDVTKPPEAAWIAEQLGRTGKSLDELETAVAYRRRRLDIKAQLDSLPALRSDLATVQADYQAEAERWGVLEGKHAAIIAPLIEKATKLERDIVAVAGLEDKLRLGYVGPLTDELAANEVEQADIQRQIESVKHTIWHSETALAQAGYSSPEYITSHKAIITRSNGELSQLYSSLKALQTRADAIAAEMIVP